MSHLPGKDYKPEHKCFKEGQSCTFSDERPASLGHLDKQIKDSTRWRINNCQIKGLIRRDRISTALLALAAARNNSSPAAKEFKEYNMVSHNCEHFVKWCAYGVRKSDQVNFKNVFKTIMKSSLYKIQSSQSCASHASCAS